LYSSLGILSRKFLAIIEDGFSLNLVHYLSLFPKHSVVDYYAAGATYTILLHHRNTFKSMLLVNLFGQCSKGEVIEVIIVSALGRHMQF
jgi:hypothetical protein